jgi:hypothetical protein
VYQVIQYDPQMRFTELFFLDGSSNVQKAGQILMAKFTCTFCFHGGEHVISLFFLSIAKIKPIKVCCWILINISSRDKKNQL